MLLYEVLTGAFTYYKTTVPAIIQKINTEKAWDMPVPAMNDFYQPGGAQIFPAPASYLNKVINEAEASKNFLFEMRSIWDSNDKEKVRKTMLTYVDALGKATEEDPTLGGVVSMAHFQGVPGIAEVYRNVFASGLTAVIELELYGR